MHWLWPQLQRQPHLLLLLLVLLLLLPLLLLLLLLLLQLQLQLQLYSLACFGYVSVMVMDAATEHQLCLNEHLRINLKLLPA